MKILKGLPPKRIPMPFNVSTNIDPKGEDKIENDRRAERNKRGINKIQTHSRRGNIHFFA